MAIRTRDDALKALSEVLAYDRRTQIVQLTIRLAQCLSPEARQILFRAQEGLVQGKLDIRLKQRAAETAEASPSENQPQAGDEAATKEGEVSSARMSEEIATALEALKLAAVAWDVFPQLTQSFSRWEVARALLYYDQQIRQIIGTGTDPGRRARSQQELAELLGRFRPWWHSQTATIEQACQIVLERAPVTRWRVGARSLLDIVATTELRAMYAAKDNIPNQQAMIEPLTKVYHALQRLLAQAYPQGLPEESALRE